MNQKNKDRLIFFGIYSLLIISAVGTMAGTYAWYEYRSRASTTFRGTAIKNARKLQIGLFSNVNLPEASSHDLIKDDTYTNIYWSREGISADTLGYFLRASGYATNMLAPTTSGSYVNNGDFNLKTHPIAYDNTLAPADHTEYVYLPLVFRVNSDISDVKVFDVRLTDAVITGVGTIKDSARIHFDGANNNFIFSPTDKLSGQNVVGGALDLDHDGYRDYANNGKEYPYGEWEGEIVYNDTPAEDEQLLPEDQRTTFNGVTKKGIYAIDESHTAFKTADYLGRKDVLAELDVAKADESTSGLAFCNVTIYLEGWSLSTIDDEVDNYFNLDLQFELFND